MSHRLNGLGGTLGAQLATCKPLEVSGSVWYVHYGTGTDAASPRGKDRQNPLKTLAQAITNATAGDIVVLLSGHAETLTAVLTISKQLYIVGEGTSSGLPAVTFTTDAATADTFAVTQAGTELWNILFPENTQDNNGNGKVEVTAAGVRIRGCYFQQGRHDLLPAITLGAGASNCRLVDTTVISTGTTASGLPAYGIRVTAAISDLETENLILSDGVAGFTNPSWDSSGFAVTRMRQLNLSLLLGADMALNATNAGSWLNPQLQTGGGRIDW